MWKGQRTFVKAFAPATVANVGCGFDVLGFAIHGPGDSVSATLSDKAGVRIVSITGEGGKLPYETEKNTAGLSVLSLLKEAGKEHIGIELGIEKKMPLGSGLGSSAASSAAAVAAVNHLLGEPFSQMELLPFAVEGELAASGTPHADNVAAALLGGFVLVKEHNPPDVIPLPSPPELYCVVIHPHIEIETRRSRQILKKEVLLEKAIRQWANMGALVSGLFREDYDLIGRSLHDEIIEPVRSVMIPGFQGMKKGAMDAGALGCSISGSGPSLFALTRGESDARRAGEKMGDVLKEIGLEFDLHLSEINRKGAVIEEER